MRESACSSEREIVVIDRKVKRERVRTRKRKKERESERVVSEKEKSECLHLF